MATMATFYRTAFTTQTVLTIPGSVHGLGTTDLLYQVYDTAGNAIQESSWHVDTTTFAITLTFAVPQSGWLAVVAAVASAMPPSVPSGPLPIPAPSGAGHLAPALRAMLTDTVTHQAYVGQDLYGKPQYSAAVLLAARIEYRVTTLATPQGQERVSKTKVYLDGDVLLTVRDLLILPDGTQPAIQAVYSPTDPLRPGVVDHIEAML